MSQKNTHLKLMDTIICRTPVFAIEDDLATCWPTLKELIRESSPEFYRVIAEWGYEQVAKNDEKATLSVWKYFNRARFRSTPFGNFAAISFARVNPHNTSHRPLNIQSQMI